VKTTILLIGIVLLAGFLRFWQLSTLPPSLTWDEVAWGYNAYSLGIDGKDEFGRFLPLDYLESYGDYKPPIYAYLEVLPIKVFGLTEFATRFSSAFFGTLMVLVTYFLTKRIFFSSSKKEWYGLAASLFLAVSPWHIMLSRAAFEANIATFFIAVGVWLYVSWIQDKKSIFLFLSLTSFILSMYTFNSARIVAPLLVMLLAFSFWKQILHYKKLVGIASLIGVILLIPAIHFFLSPQSKLRYNEVNIFSDVGLVKQSNQEIANDKNAVWSKVIHNRRLIYSIAYIQHYLDNLNPSFLFISGDGNPKFSTRDVGQLYLLDIPLLIVSILFLFRKRIDYWWIVPVWLLLAIIPAGVARETPHALRTEGALPTWQILSAVGLVEISFFFKKQRKIVLSVFLGLFTLSVFYFLHGYYAHYSREFSGEWQDGYKDALLYAKTHDNEYAHVVFTSALGRPYMYTLFYEKINPTTFRATSTITRDAFGFVNVEKVGKYNFPKEIVAMKNTLYIVSPSELPEHAIVLKKFLLQNGQPSLVAYTL